MGSLTMNPATLSLSGVCVTLKGMVISCSTSCRPGGSHDVRGVLIRDPILSRMIVVKYTARNKFLAFGGLYRKIYDSMAQKPMLLLLEHV